MQFSIMMNERRYSLLMLQKGRGYKGIQQLYTNIQNSLNDTVSTTHKYKLTRGEYKCK
jgi:hypothetical protein